MKIFTRKASVKWLQLHRNIFQFDLIILSDLYIVRVHSFNF